MAGHSQAPVLLRRVEKVRFYLRNVTKPSYFIDSDDGLSTCSEISQETKIFATLLHRSKKRESSSDFVSNPAQYKDPSHASKSRTRHSTDHDTQHLDKTQKKKTRSFDKSLYGKWFS